MRCLQGDGAVALAAEATGGGTVDVSVIVPCYNGERYLDQALASAEQNLECSIEIITVDDGSTDGSAAIMLEHERRDSRVHVIRKGNTGYGASVNRGIEEACGTYVAVLECDDYVRQHAYDHLFSLARHYDMPDVVKSSYQRVVGTEKGDVRHWHSYFYHRVVPKRQPFTLAAAPQLIKYHPSVWSALYRRDFLREEGIRFVEAPGGGWVDNPFVVEALAAARSIVYTDEEFYCYREDLSGSSTANSTVELSYDRWEERADALERRGVSDEGVVRANDLVGLKFVASALAAGALDDGVLRNRTLGILDRIGADRVASEDEISPSVRRSCLELMGADLKVGGWGYLRHLAYEAWWGLRCNGLEYVIGSSRKM